MDRHPGGPQLTPPPRSGRSPAAARVPSRPPARPAAVALILLLLGLAGCSTGGGGIAAPPKATVTSDPTVPSDPTGTPDPAGTTPGPTTPTADPPAPPDTGAPPTAAAPTTTTTAPPDGSLIPGMQGEAVLALQQRMVVLHYDPGPLDRRYGAGLTSAVMAFQKVVGMPRTGRATPDVLAAVAGASDPPPLLGDGGATRIEIDIKRQVLFYWRDGPLLRVLPISTGSGKHYCEEGSCGVAVTPSGSFRIERRIRGKHKSPLGLLYDPLYFVGGYAIHGSPSVPGYPASHGCVRIPLHVSGWFYNNVPNRTPVYVIGGRNPATPFPPDPPPADPAPAPAPDTAPVPS